MKVFYGIFLILFMMCSTVFTQTEKSQEARKFFEYEKISSQLLKEKIISLCKESGKTSWIGWIINYGTPKEVSDREKLVRKSFEETSRKTPCHHDSRIMFLRVEDKDKSKTEFWIVPPGEEPPIKN